MGFNSYRTKEKSECLGCVDEHFQGTLWAVVRAAKASWDSHLNTGSLDTGLSLL